MKKTLRFIPLSLLLIASVASPVRADECKKIHARIIDAQVTEGCTSPNNFCAAGVVTGNHGLNGTTYFVMDGAVRGPATAPGSLATSGILIFTTGHGTLTVRESGLSGLRESGNGYFTAFQEVLAGTGDYAGATGHLWVLGTVQPDHFDSEVRGELCTP